MFLIWGLWHGCFLALERTRFGSILARLPVPVQHLYAILVFICGWVWFRAESMPQAFAIMRSMLGLNGFSTVDYCIHDFSNLLVMLLLGVAMIGSTPAFSLLLSRTSKHLWLADIVKVAVTMICLGVSIMSLMVSSYSPFLYFRF